MAETTSPSRNSSSTPWTSTPDGLLGIPNRTRPFALVSWGPVKTSPEGMFRLPSELTHVRPLTSRVTSVPSASMRTVLALESRLTSWAWKAPSSCQAATGPAGRSRKSAPATKPAYASRSSPACSASASVGQSVEHQRFFIVCSWMGRRARRARVRRSGSMPASSRTSPGAWMPRTASHFFASVSARGGNSSSCHSFACS